MKNILILHPYRETYTNILDCLSPKHRYTIMIDKSKKDSFIEKLPAYVELVLVDNYYKNCKLESESLLNSREFHAIIALDEFDIVLAAELREKSNIQGQNVEQANLFRDKNIMTKKVKELGYKIPESLKVSNLKELQEFLKEHKDIIIKPIDGAGSVNTFRFKCSDDIRELSLKLFSDGKEVFLQEYIDNDIYHIDGFVSNGEVIYCEPSRYIYNPLLIKKGISAAAVSLDKGSIEYRQLTSYAISLSRRLYPEGTFLFHLEVFYDLKEITFLEIACRVGGARIRQNLEYKLGCNPFKLLVYSNSGEHLPDITSTFPNTGWLLTAKQDGVIIELPNVSSEVKEFFSIFDYIEYVKVGQVISAAYHSADAVIGLSIQGGNFKETERLLLSAEEWLLHNTRYK